MNLVFEPHSWPVLDSDVVLTTGYSVPFYFISEIGIRSKIINVSRFMKKIKSFSLPC